MEKKSRPVCLNIYGIRIKKVNAWQRKSLPGVAIEIMIRSIVLYFEI
ncbi:MAG: hypothetical protein KFF73_00345 [Cyclobacteriaceae bacterium]|nr:hypothetical protein [Cyclobacteriaceae bacterium]